jgi:hypothetical protein
MMVVRKELFITNGKRGSDAPSGSVSYDVEPICRVNKGNFRVRVRFLNYFAEPC